jgi:hypothetical protein
MQRAFLPNPLYKKCGRKYKDTKGIPSYLSRMFLSQHWGIHGFCCGAICPNRARKAAGPDFSSYICIVPHTKEHSFSYFTRMVFLLLFFCSLNLFSNKWMPDHQADIAMEQSSEVVQDVNAVITQPQEYAATGQSFPVLLSTVFSFDPAISIPARICAFPASAYSKEAPDLFCRFFYHHHSAYGDIPHR